MKFEIGSWQFRSLHLLLRVTFVLLLKLIVAVLSHLSLFSSSLRFIALRHRRISSIELSDTTMEVHSRAVSPFRTLLDGLPSRTIHNPLKPVAPPADEPNSPPMEIPNLPKNPYGLESFADFCAAVRRVKDGLPAIEAVTPPDRNEPLLIHGIQFKYWNPDQSESELSETESETTSPDTEHLENDRRKSTWSAGTPRKGILRQSISSSVVRETQLPHPNRSPPPLVYDYASTASPASRCTSRLSSRRVSIDAGVQSEHADTQDIEEEVVRTAAKKRASARRSSVAPVRRGSFVHGLAGFTGIGRAHSGAIICIANGKKFQLVVDKYDKNDDREVAVQCSAIEIDSDIEARFVECHENEVIDVDSLPENMQAEKQTGDEPITEEASSKDHPQINDGDNTEEQNEVPSPEQLRSANPAMMTPGTMNIPDLSDIGVTPTKDVENTTLEAITPTHLSLKSDVPDKNSEDVSNDEVVGISAHGSNRLSIQPTSQEPADAQATPRTVDAQSTEKPPEEQPETNTEKPFEEQPETSTPAPIPEAQMSDAQSAAINVLPEAQLPDVPPAQSNTQPEAQMSDTPPTHSSTPPEAPMCDAPPAQTSIHRMTVPTMTPSQATALAFTRQRSLSLKPSSELAVVTQRPSHCTTVGQSLCLRSVPGLDIRPTVSAYQLAAMATLSPKSYLRAIQPPSQPRVVFAFASPGGTAPVQGVDVAPPALLSTPPVATLAVAPSSTVRASLLAAPRRSHVSIPRTDLSTPSQGLLPINDSHTGQRNDGASAQISPESDALVTPAPLQNKAVTLEPRQSNSQKTNNDAQRQSTSNGSITPNMDESTVPSNVELPVENAEHSGGFIDDGDDDDFGAQPDVDDDDVVMETDEHDFEREPAGKTEIVEVEADQDRQNPAEVQIESIKSRSRKTSVASSRTRSSRRTQLSSASELRRASSVTQAVQDCGELPSDADFAISDDQNPEIIEVENKAEEEEEEEAPKKKRSRKAKATKQSRKRGQNTTKRAGQKRWRELKSLPTSLVTTNEDATDEGLRRSKRQRFPRLKFWRNETVSYERRLSQAIPTIAEVLVDVASESDDDTWFGRR